MIASLKRRIAQLDKKVSIQEEQVSSGIVPDYDPEDSESIRRVYEILFGLPEPMRKMVGGKGESLSRPIKFVIPEIPDYDPDDRESVKRAHEAVFGPCFELLSHPRCSGMGWPKIVGCGATWRFLCEK